MEYVTNRFGNVIQVTDPERTRALIAQGKLRESTPEEVAALMESRKELFAKREEVTPAVERGDVYYKTVRETPDGYGMSRGVLKRELQTLGVNMDENYAEQKVGLLYSYPYGVINLRTSARLVMTMFESDRIPADWPEYLAQADEVIVPSRWCADVFEKCGVKRPTVVPLGYNDRVFDYIERPVPVEEHKDFVFVHYNGFNMRKGFAEVLKAFSAEFAHTEPVKLIIKTTLARPPIPLPKQAYPNIEVVSGVLPEEGLKQILAGGHCFVYPSRGEGFGITPLEAMATGMPAIVPNAHGISEYFNPAYMLEVRAPGRCPGLYNRFKGQNVGEMVIADVDDLRRQMRYAYNHQAEMKELGKAASEYVKGWTYQKTAAGLKAIIDKWQETPIARRPESDNLIVERL